MGVEVVGFDAAAAVSDATIAALRAALEHGILLFRPANVLDPEAQHRLQPPFQPLQEVAQKPYAQLGGRP